MDLNIEYNFEKCLSRYSVNEKREECNLNY